MEKDAEARSKVSEWKEIFLPPHLINVPQPRWEWDQHRYMAANRWELKAIEIVFEMTPDEVQLYNELSNRDKLWSEFYDNHSAMALIFGKGNKYGMDAEFIYVFVGFLFKKTDEEFGEEWELEDELVGLLGKYKTRMMSKYSTPAEWLRHVFWFNSKIPPTDDIQNIVECHRLDKKWTTKEK